MRDKAKEGGEVMADFGWLRSKTDAEIVRMAQDAQRSVVKIVADVRGVVPRGLADVREALLDEVERRRLVVPPYDYR